MSHNVFFVAQRRQCPSSFLVLYQFSHPTFALCQCYIDRMHAYTTASIGSGQLGMQHILECWEVQLPIPKNQEVVRVFSRKVISTFSLTPRVNLPLPLELPIIVPTVHCVRAFDKVTSIKIMSNCTWLADHFLSLSHQLDPELGKMEWLNSSLSDVLTKNFRSSRKFVSRIHDNEDRRFSSIF